MDAPPHPSRPRMSFAVALPSPGDGALSPSASAAACRCICTAGCLIRLQAALSLPDSAIGHGVRRAALDTTCAALDHASRCRQSACRTGCV